MNNFWAQSAYETHGGGSTTPGVATNGGIDSGATVTTAVVVIDGAGGRGRTVTTGGLDGATVVAVGELGAGEEPPDDGVLDAVSVTDPRGVDTSLVDSVIDEIPVEFSGEIVDST